ncbi:MAG: DUF2284 domain-containing protein [Clostridium sp.]
MDNITYIEIEKYIRGKYRGIQIIKFDVNDLVYEERVKLNCYYCGKYNSNWRCPPKIPKDVDYIRVSKEFKRAALVVNKVEINDDNKDIVRQESSVVLHKVILGIEKYLYENNNSMVISYIGGSCKLCKNGCGSERCNNPYKARIPLEATGVNVIETVRKYGVNITFPPENHMIRVGLVMW